MCVMKYITYYTIILRCEGNIITALALANSTMLTPSLSKLETIIHISAFLSSRIDSDSLPSIIYITALLPDHPKKDLLTSFCYSCYSYSTSLAMNVYKGKFKHTFSIDSDHY